MPIGVGYRTGMDDRGLLRDLWLRWAQLGAGLADDDWHTPTRLPGMTVKELYAHAAPDPEQMVAALTGRVEGPAAASSGADILRAFNAPRGLATTAAPVIVEMAQRIAAELPVEALVARFTAITDEAFAYRLTAIDQDSVVAHPVLGAVTVRALTEVALVEHTVHLLDLLDAVGGPPPPPESVARAVQIVLEVPDPTLLLEAATGRGGHVVFPVMR